jgi:predicted anti-sigma-YlaC factor YlaD
MTSATSNNSICRSEEIAAYLDGELDSAASSLFEQHAKECLQCAAKLKEQRRLLCALDFALTDDPSLRLPVNFSRIVAAQAQADMSGMRRRSEHKLALWLCLALALVSFALLGGAAMSETVLAPARATGKGVVSVLGLFSQSLYDAGIGLSIILRALGRRFILESQPLSLVAFLLLAATALALLPRLITSYHRQRN